MNEKKVAGIVSTVKVIGKPIAAIVIERIESLVKGSDNKVDDLFVLPLCKMARFFFGL